MTMRFQHYIWDFDGCLCDSYPRTADLFLEVLRRSGTVPGRTLPTWDDVFLHLQVTWAHAKEYFGMTEEEYRLLHELEFDFTKDPPPPVLFAGMPELLADIVAAGGKNYLYTLRNHMAVETLERCGVASYFTDYITSDDGFPGKPAPNAVLHLMEKHRLDPAEVVMVGDRDLDGQSGLNAGASGCLLTWLTKNCDGNDPLTVTAMPWKCRGADAFRQIMEI